MQQNMSQEAARRQVLLFVREIEHRLDRIDDQLEVIARAKAEQERKDARRDAR